MVDRYKPADPVSYPGTADAVVMMASIAAQMQRRFQNDGVPFTPLSNQYLHGSLFDQMQDVQRNGNFKADIDPATGNLVIWPLNGARGGLIPLITPSTGLVG